MLFTNGSHNVKRFSEKKKQNKSLTINVAFTHGGEKTACIDGLNSLFYSSLAQSCDLFWPMEY